MGQDADGSLFYDINKRLDDNVTPGEKPGQSRQGGYKASIKIIGLDGINIKIISDKTTSKTTGSTVEKDVPEAPF